MKSKLTLGVAGITALAVLGWQQHHVNRIAHETETLRGQLAGGKSPPAAIVTNPAETEAQARLREQQDELLRLRGEVAQLRQAARPIANRTQAAPAVGAGDIDALTTQTLIAEATSVRVINALKNLGLAARVFSTEHQDRLPITFEEMKPELSGVVAADGTLLGGVSLDLIEHHPHERTVSETEPQMILFREKAPRRLPNGTWERIYSVGDGSVHRINRVSGDFSDFELEGTATAANAPTPK